MKLACDIHHHMRGFVVVSPTPWFQVCDREGRFRLTAVPAGRYVLTLARDGRAAAQGARRRGRNEDRAAAAGSELARAGYWLRGMRGASSAAPVRPWADVVDRIGVMLAESRDAAVHSADASKARRLAEDAYWVEFEASDMETAVRKYLGFGRAGELEQQFRAIRTAVRDVAAKRRSAAELSESCDRLLPPWSRRRGSSTPRE